MVDHGLRGNSHKEAKQVKYLLKKFDINCQILLWRGKKPKSNIQSIARKNRYDLLLNSCKKYNIKYLLIGHHIDDLYENFFIRLLRFEPLPEIKTAIFFLVVNFSIKYYSTISN